MPCSAGAVAQITVFQFRSVAVGASMTETRGFNSRQRLQRFFPFSTVPDLHREQRFAGFCLTLRLDREMHAMQDFLFGKVLF
jgi:hypothetical protein